MLRHFAFFLCLVALMLCSLKTFVGQTRAQHKQLLSPCLGDDQLAKAVTSLSREYDESQVAQEFLRQSSKHSSPCKQRIVAAVMRAMDKPDLDISRDQASANLWREGAILLGDLKATQSLDLLLAHIKMTDGEWSSTMSHQPALEGIIRMGRVAIPKLESMLRNQDWQTRHYAVYCLASIGGISARRALQKQLLKESNQCVKSFIQVSIETIDVKYGGVKQDHGEWAKAFLCKS